VKLEDILVAANEIATAHGFWDGPEQDNIPTKLALVHEEVSEALKCFREGEMELTWHLDKNGQQKPEGFGIELADAIIRIADLAQQKGVDLSMLIALKLSYNEGRPHMHGRRV
jgi:hypothetical protein